MRLDIRLVAKKGSRIRLPRENLYMVQAMLYSLFERSFASKLHNVGFEWENRRFKLFAFSWPKGQRPPSFEGPNIIFTTPVTVVVTSPVRPILEQLAGGALCGGELRLGQNLLECTDVRVYKPKVPGRSVAVKALSPITCYTTAPVEEGRKSYVHYHRPWDAQFQEQIDGNIRKKFAVAYPDRECPPEPVSIEPLEEPRKQIGMFRPKETVPIIGWWGRYRLEGPQELLQLALDAGIGAKNSGGWGCLEKPTRERKEWVHE